MALAGAHGATHLLTNQRRDGKDRRTGSPGEPPQGAGSVAGLALPKEH